MSVGGKPQRRHWRASNNATSMRPTKHSINAKQKRASNQPSPHKEPLWLSAHAHGIKLLNSKCSSNSVLITGHFDKLSDHMLSDPSFLQIIQGEK